MAERYTLPVKRQVKIAVISDYEEDYRMNFEFFPKGVFIPIRSPYDIRGIYFDGVLVLRHLNKPDRIEAMRLLEMRQPELFKKQDDRI